MAKPCVLEYVGRVAVLRMVKGENRINYVFMKNIAELLDEVEKNDDAKALVTTGLGKFYSNGLDLEEMMSSKDGGKDFLRSVSKLFQRLLVFPKPTIAAINGHMYAGGAMVAMAHDYRVMRSERGWFRLPEVHMKIPFSMGMMTLLKATLPQSEHINAIVMGKRYTGQEAKDVGIVHEIVPEQELMNRALAIGEKYADQEYDNDALHQLKEDYYHNVSKVLVSGPIYFTKL